MPRRITPWAALAGGALCAVVAAFVVGTAGFWGAVVGAVIVVVFFASTPAVLGPVVKADPRWSLLFALVFFVTKVVALLALFVVLSRASGDGGVLDAESVSVTVIVMALAQITARIVDAVRDRTPTYDLPVGRTGDPDRF